MLPASWFEFVHFVRLSAEESLRPPGDVADLRYGDAGDLGRNPLARRDREKEFIVLAPVQCEIKIHFANRLADLGAGNEGGIEFGAHAAFFTEVRQVGGEPVASVDHGRSQPLFAQNASEFDSGLRIKVARIVPRVQLLRLL